MGFYTKKKGRLILENPNQEEVKEVTLDGELRNSIKKVVEQLEISRGLIDSIREHPQREKTSSFYRALDTNLMRAQEYCIFSAMDYLKGS